MPPSSLPERLTGKGGAFIVTVAMGLPGGTIVGGVLTQVWVGDAVLRGAPAAAAKSVLLLPASVQPPAAPKIAVFTDDARRVRRGVHFAAGHALAVRIRGCDDVEVLHAVGGREVVIRVGTGGGERRLRAGRRRALDVVAGGARDGVPVQDDVVVARRG